MSIEKIFTDTEPMRLNKWMAHLGLCSRREAETLIAQGLIRIDGELVRDPGHKISTGQKLELAQAGQDNLNAQMTLIYHKPVGIVSGQPEPGQIPAVRMIRRANHFGPLTQSPDHDSKLAPVGRLDKDSRGLLILSEDGVVAKSIIGPNSELEKDYTVRVRGEIDEGKLKLLRHGLHLDGRQLKPAKVKRLSPQTLNFILNEGRNRQIRRMCDLVGLEVVDLYRSRIGPLSLGDLPEGMWRLLTSEERQSLIAGGIRT